jgi:hypothetical protein
MPMVTYDSKHETKDEQEKKYYSKCKHYKEETQTHVHEFLGSTKIATENGEEAHNHRFAGVTSEAIFVAGGHVHNYLTNTDFFDHHHEVGGTTGLQVLVGGGKHVHFDCGTSTFDDGHDHDFQFATLIDSPLI